MPGRRYEARMRRKTILRTGAVLAMTGAAVACGERAAPRPDAFAGTAQDSTLLMPEMTLPDMNGGVFDLVEETRGRVTLLFIGYTWCPDVCPVHLANLGAVLRDLPLEMSREVRTIFVTADPVRDTPERLREWLGAIHGDFIGLRGTRDQVNALERALGLPLSVVDPGTGPADYFVGHAGQVLAFDRGGMARLAYPWGIRQRDWRRDLPRLVAGDWPAIPARAEDTGES